MKTKWTVNSSQSDVLIRMRHSIIAYLGGPINTFQGHIEFKDNEIEDATIEFNLEVNNKDAKLEQINSSLKLNDFFDINKYPTIKFKSTSFQKANKNIHFLKGELTIKEITKTVEFDVELVETDASQRNQKVLFELSSNINRKDFGLFSNSYNQNNGLTTGQDIKLVANLEFGI